MSQSSFAAILQRAEASHRQGATAEATALFRQALALQPGHQRAWTLLGDANAAAQAFQDAADAYDQALQLNSADYQTALKLAHALAAVGNFGACYYVLDHAEKLRPDDRAWVKLRLEIARGRRDWPALETLALQLARIAPEDPEGWRDLATAFFEAGRYGDAVKAFEKTLDLTEQTATALAQYASLALRALEFAKADAALIKAEAMEPNNAQVLSTKALLLTYQGKTAEAEAYCRRCLEADPEFMSVYPQLSALRNGRLTEDEEAPLKSFSRRDDIAVDNRLSASFVLAHSYDARGDVDQAFSEYSHANQLTAERNRRDEIIYNHEGLAAWTAAIQTVFCSPPETGSTAFHEGPQPIFVVGLPRSGSTLVESVISSHSKVAAGGEMPMMPMMFNAWFKRNYNRGDALIGEEEKREFAQQYIRDMPAKVSEDYVTDKNLLNIEAAGFIAQIFPRSVIINIRRSPLECGFSIWRQNMPKFWAYADSLDSIGRRYSLYARLTDHFEHLLGDRFITVQYEDFVDNFDEQARNLMARCDLDWEDACAAFQDTRAVAATLSAVQVREAVSKKAARAERYGNRLDPLRRALEAAGVDLTTGAMKP